MLRTEWPSRVARHLVYEARKGRLWWIPGPVRENIRSLDLMNPFVSMDQRDGKDAIQLRSLLGLLDLVHLSALPHGRTL